MRQEGASGEGKLNAEESEVVTSVRLWISQDPDGCGFLKQVGMGTEVKHH